MFQGIGDFCQVFSNVIYTFVLSKGEYTFWISGKAVHCISFGKKYYLKRGNNMDRNVNIIVGLNGEKIVLINDIRFRGKKREDWKEVEAYLKEYVGEFYEIEETSEKIFISSGFPNEYVGSESRIALKGAVAKAKANAAQGIPELIQIATNKEYSQNSKKKHEKDAKYGWYRYDVRFALPVYDDRCGEVCRYNIFFARMLVRHDADGKKYLYDLLAIKKETSSPHE